MSLAFVRRARVLIGRRFARYHENNTLEYGLAGDDKYAREFADFDYTS